MNVIQDTRQLHLDALLLVRFMHCVLILTVPVYIVFCVLNQYGN